MSVSAVQEREYRLDDGADERQPEEEYAHAVWVVILYGTVDLCRLTRGEYSRRPVKTI